MMNIITLKEPSKIAADDTCFFFFFFFLSFTFEKNKTDISCESSAKKIRFDVS